MHRRTSPKVFRQAYALRHHLTEAEQKLWQVLRSHHVRGIHFRRQHGIGPFIVDFCAPSVKLIIEVDGDHHQDQHEYDEERTAYLKSKGYWVLRFWNHEVLDHPDAVIRSIMSAVDELMQSPPG